MSEQEIPAFSKYRVAPSRGGWRLVTVLFPTVALLLTVMHWFYLRPGGFMMYELTLLFMLVAAFLPLNFLWVPPTAKASKQHIPWYDLVLAAMSFVTPLYFCFQQEEALLAGWDISAPLLPTILAFILWLLVIEATRRGTGPVLAGVVLFFSFYPLWADVSPVRFLWGPAIPLGQLISAQIISTQGLMGIVMGVFGELVFGFMVFAAVVQAFGAGRLFNDLATALVAKTRGGVAKVSIVSSGFFASISGAVGPNVLTTGAFTIPAMKRQGFPPAFAAGVEAAASSGGTITPPVMGAVAFVMSEFIEVPYANICLAAAVPSFLYFLCLFMQIDAFAARKGLAPQAEISEAPPIWLTLVRNLHILLGILVLVGFLFLMRITAQAPFLSLLVIVGLGMLQKRHRINVNGFLRLMESIGRMLGDLMPTLAAIGLIIGALSATGVALALPHEMMKLAGGSSALMLVIGAVGALILGMGMTVTAVYVFLAIVLAPALVEFGFNIIAAHLFVIYWGVISHITPPVAIAAFVAAPIAGANPMETGFQAMKLGAAKYILPFVFVVSPSLILHGPLSQIIWVIPTTVLGLIVIAGALEGYLWNIGVIGWVSRVLLFAGGLALTVPVLSVSFYGLGLVLILLFFSIVLVRANSHLARHLVVRPAGKLATIGLAATGRSDAIKEGFGTDIPRNDE